MRGVLLAIPLALASTSASANELYDKCMEASDGTNPGYAQCGGDWVRRADARLNEVWKDLYSQVEENTKRDLLAEQRLWLAYKEKSCIFYNNGDWGREGQVIQFPVCRAKVIEVRINQLENFFDPISGE